ncbi:MAG: hypothetical protein OXT65_05405 [Alphaproteobacteria bacterium]|nr:hypothetical protein [Alphaproteobacteria bacterium]
MMDFLKTFLAGDKPAASPPAKERDVLLVAGYEPEDKPETGGCGTKKSGCGGCGCG